MQNYCLNQPWRRYYIIRENFLAFEEYGYARATLIIGLLMSLILALVILHVPQGFPFGVFSAFNVFIAYTIVKNQFQFKYREQLISPRNKIMQTLKMSLFISLLGLAVYVALGLALALLLPVQFFGL
jgi:hypothetical protein